MIGRHDNAETSGGVYRAALWISDFDDSQFLTSSELPTSGIGVNEAYQLGIGELFGPEALKRYLQGDGQRDGHRGRTPAQIVQDSLPDITPDEIPEKEKELVDYKLAVLLDQIGTPVDDKARWPRPTAGFLPFMERLLSTKGGEIYPISGIVSAGHLEFIEATYAYYGLDLPDIVITDVDVQKAGRSLTPEQRAKPSPFAMQLAVGQWRLLNPGSTAANLKVMPNRLLYTGDDIPRDRDFAKNGGAEFIWIPPQLHLQEAAWQDSSRYLGIGSTALEGATDA